MKTVRAPSCFAIPPRCRLFVCSDTDLNRSMLDKAEARQQHEEIAYEANFHSAMNGASSFIGGETIAASVQKILEQLGQGISTYPWQQPTLLVVPQIRPHSRQLTECYYPQSRCVFPQRDCHQPENYLCRHGERQCKLKSLKQKTCEVA